MHKALQLADLVDMAAIQTMADSHFRAAGMPLGIIDAINGSILVRSGWQEICERFHRINSASRQRCHESDAYIKTHLVEGEACRYRCKNGLWDIGIPIMVESDHLATLFFGQFFFEGEAPDREFFAKQAAEFGFELEPYLAALDEVPVLSHEKVNTILEFNRALAAFIASLAKNAISKLESERTIAHNHERFLLAQTVGNIGIWDWDIRSGALYWSEQIEPMFGFARGQFAGTYEAFLGCIHPDDRQHLIESVDACVEEGKEYGIEHRIVWPDKTTHWVSETGTVFRDDNGKACRMIGVVLDITERKRNEEDLRLSEQKYSSIFQLMPDMVGITRVADGKFIEVNAGFEKCTGWRRHEALGLSSLELGLWDPEVRAEAVRVVEEEGHLENFEFILRRKSGEKRNALMYLTKIKVMEEECFYFIVRDITESKRAEEKIHSLNNELEQRVKERTSQLVASNQALSVEIAHRQRSQDEIELLNKDLRQRSEALELANNELESFCYSVSHDLRAPLRHMSAYSRILMEDCGDCLDNEAAGYLERIDRAANKMGDLIDALLQLSRISRAELNMQTVDLSRMALEILSELQEAAPGRRIEANIATGLVGMADPTLMHSMLQNLLGNAVKYTRDVSPAIITFDITQQDENAIFCIRDNGAGFEMAYVDRLFGPFERLHGPEYEGTGIGLATVQRIIYRHGGKIWAEAEPGKGAAFYFTLPPLHRTS